MAHQLSEFEEKQLLNICQALGGYVEDEVVLENGRTTTVSRYVPGDEVIECLKDLKRILRRDDDTIGRKVFITLGTWDIMHKDLLPILMTCDVEKNRKLAMSVVELLVPMTWPIAEDAENIPLHVEILNRYKEEFLKDGILDKIMKLLLMALSTPFRFFHFSMISAFDKNNVLELILTFAASMDEREYAEWNMVILEIVYHIFRDRDASELAGTKDENEYFASRILLENAAKNPVVRSSRHGRFGGTLMLKLENGAHINLHNSKMALKSVENALDLGKKEKRVGGKKMQQTEPVICRKVVNKEARAVLSKIASMFVENSFNALANAVKKDFDMERTSVRETDYFHFLKVVTFTLDFQMLEKFSKSKAFMVVRKKRRKKESRPDNEVNAVNDEISDDENGAKTKVDMVEHEFRFEKMEMDLAYESVVSTYCELLKQYKVLDLKYLTYITVMLHRIFVKCKMEPLLYKLSIFELFNKIIDDRHTMPSSPALKELQTFIKYVLSKFTKKSIDTPALLIELLFPKSRSDCTRIMYGEKEKKAPVDVNVQHKSGVPEEGELEFAKKMSWQQKVSAVVSLLVKEDRKDLVEWVQLTLSFVAAQKGDGGAYEDEDVVLADEARGNENVLEALRDNNRLHILLRLFKIYRDAREPKENWVIRNVETAEELLVYCKAIQESIESPLDFDKPLSKLIRLVKPKKTKATSSKEVVEDDQQEAEKASNANHPEVENEENREDERPQVREVDDDFSDDDALTRALEMAAAGAKPTQAQSSSTLTSSRAPSPEQGATTPGKRGYALDDEETAIVKAAMEPVALSKETTGAQDAELEGSSSRAVIKRRKIHVFDDDDDYDV
ncbi:Topoisomerase 1-associated factor 1 [Chytridiales sp. JEL 0842]|nr:Topoisomerase 1-associated factor 1 [Chytridiales sp. JEL 0842]